MNKRKKASRAAKRVAASALAQQASPRGAGALAAGRCGGIDDDELELLSFCGSHPTPAQSDSEESSDSSDGHSSKSDDEETSKSTMGKRRKLRETSSRRRCKMRGRPCQRNRSPVPHTT